MDNNQNDKMPSIIAKIDWLVNNENRGSYNVKAFASIIIGNIFTIHGIKVIENASGLFV